MLICKKLLESSLYNATQSLSRIWASWTISPSTYSKWNFGAKSTWTTFGLCRQETEIWSWNSKSFQQFYSNSKWNLHLNLQGDKPSKESWIQSQKFFTNGSTFFYESFSKWNLLHNFGSSSNEQPTRNPPLVVLENIQQFFEEVFGGNLQVRGFF